MHLLFSRTNVNASIDALNRPLPGLRVRLNMLIIKDDCMNDAYHKANFNLFIILSYVYMTLTLYLSLRKSIFAISKNRIISEKPILEISFSERNCSENSSKTER